MSFFQAAICGNCNRTMRCETVGVTLEMQDSRDPERARPYYLVQADLYQCPGCGAKVYTEFGNGATYRYHEDFARKQAAAVNRVKVT